MTTLLRQYGPILRATRSGPHPALCRSCITKLVNLNVQASVSGKRSYATDPQESQRNDGTHSATLRRARTSQGSKPAKGFENLYGSRSALSFARHKTSESQDQKTKNSEDVELPEGRVPISEAHQKRLDNILQRLSKSLPASQMKDLEGIFASFRKVGIPKELHDIVEKLEKGRKLDMATAWKIVKLTTESAKRAAENFVDEEEPGAPKSSSKQGHGKEGRKSSEGRKESDGKKDAKPDFSFTGSIDATTFATAVFLGYLIYKALIPGENSKEITFQEFKATFLDKGLVEKLTVINQSKVKVELHREAVARMYPESPAQHSNFRYYFTIGSVEAFERKLDEAQEDLRIPSSQRIPVKYVGQSNFFQLLLSFGPTVLFFGLLYFISRRASGSGGGSSGIFNMGRSRAKKFNHEQDINTRFADVAGMDEAKQEIMEFVSFLKDPAQYKKLGAKIPRGALLSGPPGTGKTLLAKATAGESGVPFYSISGSEFVEIFVGVGASRVRDLFQTARKNTPCIIFIDEIDAVGKSRAKSTGFGGNDEREGTLNQILTEMDGFNTSEQVVVLAGTNRPDVLDKALLRPGRFDRHIAIDAPTMEGRKQIFKVHLGKVITKEEMEHLTGRLAALTPGFSGADIANCVNEAALIAARSSAESIAMKHFEQAIERVVGGLEKKSLVLNPEEKRTVAYHEAGHAICGWFFKYADPLLKVSIIPRGQGALGYAQYLPGDVHLMTASQLMDRMAMALGGRVSEELHFDTVTSGASDDFNKVTRMATAMVTKWGMSSKMGYVYFDDSSQESRFQKPFSEHTAQEIDAEVRRIVDEALKQCRDLLMAKKKEIGLIAEELLSKEVLGRDDMIRLLGKRPFADNKEFSKYFGGGEEESAPPAPPSVEGNPPPPPPPPSGGVAAVKKV